MAERQSDAAVHPGLGRDIPRQRRWPAAPDGRAQPAWQARLAALFPADPQRPRHRRAWIVAVLAVLAGTLVSLGRVARGPGVLNTIFAEDGSDFLTGALNGGPATVLEPLNGYLTVVPRLLAAVAAAAPVRWGPAVLTIEAALVTAVLALAVYVASRSHLRHPYARLIAAVPVVAVPIGENGAAAVANNVATLQFAAVYAALWMVLWVPASRAGRVSAVGVVLATALTTFLSVVLLPLAVLRVYLRRDRISALLAGGLALGAVANVVVLSLGLTSRPVVAPSRYDPVWALSRAAAWALPHSLFGYRISGQGGAAVDPSWLVWPAWILLLAAVTVAALRLTRPARALAAVMGITAVALVGGPIMQLGVVELRYVVAPELMLFAGLAALLLPRTGEPGRPAWLTWAPAAALSAFVTLVLVTSYSTAGPRSWMAAWDASVAEATVVCADQRYVAAAIDPQRGTVQGLTEPVARPYGRSTGYPFLVQVPCRRLR